METQPFTRMWWHTAQRWTGKGVHLRSLQSTGGNKGEYSYRSTEAQRSGMGLGISPMSGVLGFLTEGHVIKAGWPGVHACVVHVKAKSSLTSMSPTHLTLTISHHHSCPGLFCGYHPDSKEICCCFPALSVGLSLWDSRGKKFHVTVSLNETETS